jgi:hypothetical protein
LDDGADHVTVIDVPDTEVLRPVGAPGSWAVACAELRSGATRPTVAMAKRIEKTLAKLRETWTIGPYPYHSRTLSPRIREEPRHGKRNEPRHGPPRVETHATDFDWALERRFIT